MTNPRRAPDDETAVGRPTTVLVACVMVYLGSAVSFTGYLAYMVWWAVEVAWLGTAVAGYVAVVAIVTGIPVAFAVLTQNGVRAGRVGLTVVSLGYVVVGVMTVAGGVPLALAWVLYLVVCAVLPWIDASGWFRRRRRPDA